MRSKLPQRETLKRMPPRLSAQTSEALHRTWQALQHGVASVRTLKGLPPFAESLAEIFWATTPNDVMVAMQRGDVSYFVALLLRLDQLNSALVKAGRSIADRAPIVNAKWVVEGFRMTAETNLKKLGGQWPPGSDWGE